MSVGIPSAREFRSMETGGGALQHVVPSSAGALTMVSKESPGRMATLGVFSAQPPHSVLLFPLWGP